MNNVVPIDKGKYGIVYIFDDKKKVIGVTHPDWPFRIQRSGEEIAMVCEETDTAFGVLDRNNFNTILACWLLIDDPSIFDGGESNG